MTLGIIVEILLSVLLVAVLIYAVLLHRHLTTLKFGGDDLKKLMGSFNTALDQAASSIQTLKQTVLDGQGTLTQKIKDAHNMCEDLEFLIGRSEALFNDLEKQLKNFSTESTLDKEAFSLDKELKKRKPKLDRATIEPMSKTIEGEYEESKIFKGLQRLR